MLDIFKIKNYVIIHRSHLRLDTCKSVCQNTVSEHAIVLHIARTTHSSIRTFWNHKNMLPSKQHSH